MNAPDYDLLRALKYRERWRYIPFAGQIQEALDRDDPSAIVPFFLLLMRGRWMKLKTYLRCQNGLGNSTEYGRWLQSVLEQGDWIKTSAINSQSKARNRGPVDLDLPAWLSQFIRARYTLGSIHFCGQ